MSPKGKAGYREWSKRDLEDNELPPDGKSIFVECSVLMNVEADGFVAVFGVAQDGKTLAECAEKMDRKLKGFLSDLNALGFQDDDVFVDFITQTKLYRYEVGGEFLDEKLLGFELKKNVSIRYKEEGQIEPVALAAARSGIVDLIKVDYVMEDVERIQDRLREEAVRRIEHKMSRYERLLGIKLRPPGQVYTESYAMHYPTEMYDSYSVSNSEVVYGSHLRRKYVVREARKSSTTFFDALDADGFDAVIDPVVVKPVVQCTLYLKLKYDIEKAGR